MTTPEQLADQKPHSIIFFHNGVTAVCNASGQQIPKYQGGHKEAIDAMRADGFDWRNISDVTGHPSYWDAFTQ